MNGMNVKQFWQDVRRLAAELDPEAAMLDARETERSERYHLDRSDKEIWVISQKRNETGGVAGRVVSTIPIVAARWILESTHVLATEEQVAAHQAKLAAAKMDIEKAENDRKGVPTSKLLEALVEGQKHSASSIVEMLLAAQQTAPQRRGREA